VFELLAVAHPVDRDLARTGTHAGQVGEENVRLPHSLAKAEAKVMSDIRATTRGSAADAVLRSLQKSATTLGFDETKSEVDKRARSDQHASKTQ